MTLEQHFMEQHNNPYPPFNPSYIPEMDYVKNPKKTKRKTVIYTTPYSVCVRIPSRNTVAKVVAWTGGSEPDSYWNMPLAYREIVGGIFQDMLSILQDKHDKDLKHYLWNRAKLDGYRTWCCWMDSHKH